MPSQPRGWLRRLTSHTDSDRSRRRVPIDLGRAFTAILLSLAIYVVAAGQSNAESNWQTSFTVPVDLVNVPSGLVATQDQQTVHVNLRSTETAFNKVQQGSFSAQVDASGAHAGDNQLPVQVRSSNSDVSAVTADPSAITVHLDELQQRSLPVQVIPTGDVPQGYQVGKPTASPDTVTVTGPGSVVQQATAAVINVPVQGATLSVNGTYTSTIVDAHGSSLSAPDLSFTPPAISVQVPINQLTQYKQVGVQPVTSGVPAAGYVVDSIAVDPPTATLVGSAAALETDSLVQTQPIDIGSVNSTVVRQVGLAPPTGSILLDPTQRITATVHVTPLQMTETVQAQPSVINLPADVGATGSLPPVSLTLTGPSPTLSQLAGGNLQVVLDVSGKAAGQYNLSPQVQNLPQGITLDNTNPQTVPVELVASNTSG
jgi:YbbR domain-containing protein